jgi:hypothetical protein
MLVSMDVSTSDDNATHRIFGRVSEVMLKECGSAEDTILATEESRNFKTSVSRELLQAALFAFGRMGGNVVGGEYRSEWEQCRDALFASSPPSDLPKPDLTTEERGKVHENAWQLAENVWRDLDRKSCPGVYLQIASESIIKHFQSPTAPVLDGDEQWRDGAKFALRAVGNLDSLFFLTDSMKIAAIENATKSVIAERDRRALLTQEAS